ncbi:lytic transglycosylase domain-containing protein [Flavihumibacter profundi]|uniref:lytic transglycosylase domain-containing protein n=1 Tax=Flavihumibacter profundi TaxID=2716883 RepID=UPI001CC387D3|nr:lytic transglycosylase domain-containing protein [Flavihumibacter profundi]MBZ5856791.1 lytic transglycosylase domain-containing protein [Flavihumibacter profundi]
MLPSQVIRVCFTSILLLSLTITTGRNTSQVSLLTVQKENALHIKDKANAFIQKYISANTENLEDIRKKSISTFHMMDKILNHYELPLELKYLAVIESELNPKALSPVGAAGTWQLMPETGRILGLTITAGIDERLDAKKSTKAAAIYLRDLYTEFGDWQLVLAAYNCGPGPIYTAMQKSGSKNFWMLQKYLPRESREHVHKFIATYQYFEGGEKSMAFLD